MESDKLQCIQRGARDSREDLPDAREDLRNSPFDMMAPMVAIDRDACYVTTVSSVSTATLTQNGDVRGYVMLYTSPTATTRS